MCLHVYLPVLSTVFMADNKWLLVLQDAWQLFVTHVNHINILEHMEHFRLAYIDLRNQSTTNTGKMIHPGIQLFLMSEQLLKLMIIVGLTLARPYCTMYCCILNSARVPGKLHDSNAEILPNPLSSLAVGGV